MYKNVLFSEGPPGLSPILYESAVVFVESDFSCFYIVEGGAWVKKTIGPNLELSWPVGSVFSIFNEKDPADIFGFGKWELIKKEEAGSGVIYSWVRLD